MPLARPSRILVVLIGAAVASILAWIEAVMLPQVGFLAFYLPLMVGVGWIAGAGSAVVVTALAVVAWTVGTLTSGHGLPAAVVGWNALNHLLVLGALGMLTAFVRRGRDRLLDLARTDPVTGLPNARAFLEHLEREAARARRSGSALCVGYADLDNFKRLNDLHGHAAGNELLRRVGEVFRDSLRAGDVPARIGGDEFAVLFDHADADDAERIGRRLVTLIQGLGREYPGSRLGASFGVVHLSHPPEPHAILHLADEAMYRAKQAGKGEVCVTRIDNRAPRLPYLSPAHALEPRDERERPERRIEHPI